MDLMRNYGNIARAITEADVESGKDAVRGQVAGEYQRLYQICMESMGSLEDGGQDVRYAELAVRILDRVVKLYRIDSRPASDEKPIEDVGVETEKQRSIIAGQIAELAARTNPTAE